MMIKLETPTLLEAMKCVCFSTTQLSVLKGSDDGVLHLEESCF